VRPPFLLETQPRISVLQLYVPLPVSARGALPPQWTPRVLIEGDGDGKSPALLVAFTLPHPAAYVGCGGEDAPVLALHLPLVRRVETGKAALRVAEDHVSLRLPFFYTGSVLPERPPSLVTVEELSALRQHGWELACRFCGAPLLQRGAAGGAAEGGGAPPPAGSLRAPPRVLQLPSEHWLEWAELWMCHEGQENALLPRDGEGEHCALLGALLVGEAHLQPHVGDLAPGALLLRSVGVSAGAGAGARGAAAPPAPAALLAECARCGAAVGRLTAPLGAVEAAALSRAGCALLPPPGAPRAGARARAAQPPAILPLLSAAALEALPHALNAGAHPQLRLFKDALWLPHSSPAPRPEAFAWAAGDGAGARGHGGGGALHLYSLCTRVAVPMLTTAQEMCRYRFLLSGAAGSDEDTPTLVLATLLNWNTSIRASAACAEGAVATNGGGGGGGALKPWEYFGDLPCLKLRFVVLGCGGGGGGGGGGAEPPHEHAPEVLEMAHTELMEVLAVLRETSQLLPPSVRVMDGCEVGFLPFVSAPLKRICT
jgi:hypothetical protein